MDKALQHKAVAASSILAIIATAFFLFGMPAFKVIAAFSLIAALFFVILRHLGLDLIETIILSAIFAIGIFSTYTYWLALLVNSVWTSMIIALLLIGALAAYFHFYENHRNQAYIIAAIISLAVILWLIAYLFVVRSIQTPEYVQQFYECVKSLDALTCSQRY